VDWQEITVSLSAADAAQAESLLRLAGAEAVTLADAGDDPVLEPAPGAIEIWPNVLMTALFAAGVDTAGLSELLKQSADIEWVEARTVSESDWIGGWRQSVDAIEINERLRIVPSEQVDSAPSASAVMLNMGLAFGTGRHATTRLCLEWLASQHDPGPTALDFGCGSGILALAALKLGTEFVYATDNDPQALIATRENAKLNGMTKGLWLGAPEALPGGRRVDLILANILAGTLCDLADDFARRHTAGGRLLLSGILTAQRAAVIAAYSDHYQNFQTAELDGWLRIAAERRH
jgi:ribosomal protein L11 methyltransferase